MDNIRVSFFITLLVVLSFYSCSIDDDGNTNTGNYINFYIGDDFYEGYSSPEISLDLEFDELNYYDLESNKIIGVTNSLPFQIYLEPNYTHPDFGTLVYFSGNGYYSLTTKEDCDSGLNTVLDYQVNITRNDEEVGGLIQGLFDGKIGRPNGFPCNNCCYSISDFSGEFKLIIK